VTSHSHNGAENNFFQILSISALDIYESYPTRLLVEVSIHFGINHMMKLSQIAPWKLVKLPAF